MYEHYKPYFTPIESLYLTLEYYEGLSVEEIAAALGVSLNETLTIQKTAREKALELRSARRDEDDDEDEDDGWEEVDEDENNAKEER